MTCSCAACGRQLCGMQTVHSIHARPFYTACFEWQQQDAQSNDEHIASIQSQAQYDLSGRACQLPCCFTCSIMHLLCAVLCLCALHLLRVQAGPYSDNVQGLCPTDKMPATTCCMRSIAGSTDLVYVVCVGNGQGCILSLVV
jgi:hypothetical protein